jgi:hypothetical protein
MRRQRKRLLKRQMRTRHKWTSSACASPVRASPIRASSVYTSSARTSSAPASSVYASSAYASPVRASPIQASSASFTLFVNQSQGAMAAKLIQTSATYPAIQLPAMPSATASTPPPSNTQAFITDLQYPQTNSDAYFTDRRNRQQYRNPPPAPPFRPPVSQKAVPVEVY